MKGEHNTLEGWERWSSPGGVGGTGLTQHPGDDGRPLGLRQVDAQEVDGDPWQRDGDANEGVDRVAVERHRHQEDGAAAEHHREEERQLGGDSQETPSTTLHLFFTSTQFLKKKCLVLFSSHWSPYLYHSQ